MNTADLLSALQLMWQGMLAIFIVMAAISIIVSVFTKVSGKKKTTKED